MIIKTLEDGTRRVGDLVTWSPQSNLPVIVPGVGALTLDNAWRLRNDLTGIVNDSEEGATTTVHSLRGEITEMTPGEARQLRDELTMALRLAAEEGLAP